MENDENFKNSNNIINDEFRESKLNEKFNIKFFLLCQLFEKCGSAKKQKSE